MLCGNWKESKSSGLQNQIKVKQSNAKGVQAWLGSWLGEAHQVGWVGGKIGENRQKCKNSRQRSFENFGKSWEEITKKFSKKYERTYERTVLWNKVFLKTKLRKMKNFCADLRQRQKMGEKGVFLKVKSLLYLWKFMKTGKIFSLKVNKVQIMWKKFSRKVRDVVE